MRRFASLIVTAMVLCLTAHIAAAADATPSKPQALVQAYLAENDFGKSNAMLQNWASLPATQRVALLQELASHLDDRAALAIVNTHDNYVSSRLASGQMKFDGHGRMSHQDFFIAGGKAAWAIERVIDTSSPLGVRETMPDEERTTAIMVLRSIVEAYAHGIEAAAPKSKP